MCFAFTNFLEEFIFSPQPRKPRMFGLEREIEVADCVFLSIFHWHFQQLLGQFLVRRDRFWREKCDIF